MIVLAIMVTLRCTALFIECFSTRVRGLGLGGALSIPFGVVLAVWLVGSSAAWLARGAVLVRLGISVFEVFSMIKPKST